MLTGFTIISGLATGLISNAEVVVAPEVALANELQEEILVIEADNMSQMTNNDEYVDSIYCSCVKTVREQGIDFPTGKNAEDFIPNSTIKEKSIAVFNYDGTYHIAYVKAVNTNSFAVIEGNYEKCKKTEREVSMEDKSLIGFWVDPTEAVNVTEVIKNSAIEQGVDVLLALNIACAESCMTDKITNKVIINPVAKNKYSSASGVYQFIDSTWDSYCSGTKLDAADNVRCAVSMLKNGGESHWAASRYEGFGGGWSNNPYLEFDVVN